MIALAADASCVYNKQVKAPGRPRKPRSQARWQRLDLRVSEEEKETFKLAAENANQDLSVWIRIQLHRAAKRVLPGDPQDTKQDDNIEPSQTDSNRVSRMR